MLMEQSTMAQMGTKYSACTEKKQLEYHYGEEYKDLDSRHLD